MVTRDRSVNPEPEIRMSSVQVGLASATTGGRPVAHSRDSPPRPPAPSTPLGPPPPRGANPGFPPRRPGAGGPGFGPPPRLRFLPDQPVAAQVLQAPRRRRAAERVHRPDPVVVLAPQVTRGRTAAVEPAGVVVLHVA